MPADEAVSASPDFFGYERAQCDLPYYRGGAGGFGLTSVFVVFCATAGAFAVLMKAQQSFHSGLAGFIPPLLFVLIPLIAVAVVAGPAAPLALFRRLGLRDIGIILLFFVLVHLPTYQWNIPQAFGLMPIRIVLLLSFIITTVDGPNGPVDGGMLYEMIDGRVNMKGRCCPMHSRPY